MVLNEDEDMKRIYEGKYPDSKIYCTAIKLHKTHEVIFDLSSAYVSDDKQGHLRQNVELKIIVTLLCTEQITIREGEYILVLPRISFYNMFAEAGISLGGNTRSYHVYFKKKNKKTYLITRHKELTPLS